MRRCIQNVTLLVTCGLASVAGAQMPVGLMAVNTREPVTDTAVPAAVFYPALASGEQAGSVMAGPYRVEATPGAAPAPGRHPLLVLSHGNGGTRYGHHDLAVALARQGYVVVAPEHAGNHHGDQSGFGTDRVLLGRAWQASRALDAVLSDDRLGPHVDAARIGAVGFSAGGYTTLLLAGAVPDFARFDRFCEAHPGTPELCDPPPAGGMHTLSNPPPTADRRVRAAFVMAPLALVFDSAGVSDMHAPVFLLTAEHDEVLMPSANGDHLRSLLPDLAGSREIAGAGHFVFLAPCPPPLVDALPQLCVDPHGIDREAEHARIAADALAFFDRYLPGEG
ncbi:dienelactone hydrolase family protein [Luteimonas sp. 3794]|uniref:alpha/beta hydrolase family protein n=1 Tax=Luteimonas sp. 3794 TaxID=2817730 RepID=UPI002859ADE8|nr:dienelactone hydrolase family protein [Luteimonas sp. 3794]MDR6990644.1 putative dienelactone hydrolase [Luteimonas sp. 3794]